ncbi:MAG: glutamate--tRNA ligase [Rhodospirillales bacterium]|nr:glutamate--tRNA ligase [Rhodospirillales bacterium]
MSVVTRFAPSPTGFLHIGGARTALFNWLFARHHGGRFLLRVEDTDKLRSTPEAVAAIFDGLRWLGLDADEAPVFQSSRALRHVEVVQALLASGKAYRCYASVDELAEMRERARSEGRPFRYDGRWRDRQLTEAPPGVDPVIRLRAPETGQTSIHDLVQGDVTVANSQLDDMVLLRADGSPTYMLAVVVDDHDMGISHVIRGDDHLSNAFRQYQLYRALDWTVPEFAHVPLIHGPDGAKMSKRHGALGVDAYRDQGFLPEALCNYLLRLGWSHGDDEVISRDEAVAWFDLPAVGRSAARFDFAKLGNLNGVYMRGSDPRRIADLAIAELAKRLGREIAPAGRERIRLGIDALRQRAKTIVELAEAAAFYAVDSPIALSPAARALLTHTARAHLQRLRGVLDDPAAWTAASIEDRVRRYATDVKDGGVPLKEVAQPLRAALTGTTVSPPVFEVMQILGQKETLTRLDDVLNPQDTTPCADDTAVPVQ